MKKLFFILISIFFTIYSVSASEENQEIKAANYLASSSYINNFLTDVDKYRINEYISRKEVMKIIINISKLKIKDNCSWKFSDVVNDWGCKYIENALNSWYIVTSSKFRPDDNITVKEVLKLVFKARKIEKKYDTWDWWKDYIDTAKDMWFISDNKVDWDSKAKRWLIFLIISNTYDEFKNYDSKIVKENKTDLYWVDFNLKIIDKEKFELVWDNIPNNISSVSILSCKENLSKNYDENWYTLTGFKTWNSSFKYSIDKKYNNYCLIPYKVKLSYIWWETQSVDLNLNLDYLWFFTDKTLLQTWTITQFNLNTIRLLKEEKSDSWSYRNITIVDKNNLYTYYNWWPEAKITYFKVQDYSWYKYVWNELIWDNYLINSDISSDGFWKKLFQIDSATFESIKDWYYKDKSNYYTTSWIIWNINKDFEILSYRVYKYDWNYYTFLWNIKLDVWDNETFMAVEKEDLNIWDSDNYIIITKDKENLYILKTWIDYKYIWRFKWDYDTYKRLDYNIAVDKYSLYYLNSDWDIKQFSHKFDLNTLKYEGDNLFSDKNWEYYLDVEKGMINK